MIAKGPAKLVSDKLSAPPSLQLLSFYYFFRRILMVMMVFHEPSGPRIEDVNTLWSGLFNSVTSLNLEGVCGLETGPSVSHVRIFRVASNMPSYCQMWLVMVSITVPMYFFFAGS